MKLELLPYRSYRGVKHDDPLRFYFVPVIGTLYRQRVELCLAECKGGARVLEVGFGSGVTFLNLNNMYKEIHGLDLDASIADVHQVFRAKGIETSLLNGSVTDMPYPDNYFDTILLISILEHLKPNELNQAFSEIHRVLKPGGQAVYGVPIERKFMVFMFYLLGFNIRQHHFSSEIDVLDAANRFLKKVKVFQMRGLLPIFPKIYEIGHFVKSDK
jgi:ubiquinone/menaquinone biosynthesis C-methylase UbiE